MTALPEKLPCPFCGSPHPKYQLGWGVRCTACDASVPCRGDDYSPWNRRAILDTPEALAKSPHVQALVDALIWCSGSNDFQEGGVAREGWLKLCAPLIQPAAEDDPPCTDCDDTGITHQTERYCTCDAGRALAAAIREVKP